MNNIFIILVALFHFATHYATAQKVKNENGVKVVENGKEGLWGKNPKLKIDFIGTIGNPESNDKNLIFNSPNDLAFDKEGNIYLLDAGNSRIQKFSINNKYITTIGRKGRGPSEFLNPNSISIDNKDNIYVYDCLQNCIKVMDSKGKQFKMIKTVGSYSQIYLLDNGNILAKKYESSNIILLDASGKVIDKKANCVDLADKGTPDGRGGNAFYYSFTLDENNNIYTAYEHQNRIDKFSFENKNLLNISRDVHYSLKRKGNLYFRLSRSIGIDGKGRIWTLTAKRMPKRDELVFHSSASEGNISTHRLVDYVVEKGDLYELELYDAEGKLLYKFPLDRYYSNMKIKGDKIYLIDKDFTSCVYVYEIKEL